MYRIFCSLENFIKIVSIATMNLNHRRRLRNIEELRGEIPLRALLLMSYQVAAQGILPILDDEGRPTGRVDTVDPVERMKVIKSLLDKGMPNNPVAEEALGHEAPDAKEIEAIIREPDRLSELDNTQLLEMVSVTRPVVAVEDPWA